MEIFYLQFKDIILTDTNLSDKERHIYSIIMFLSKENNYCYCTNSNISELLNISITQVSKLVNSLKKKEDLSKLYCGKIIYML